MDHAMRASTARAQARPGTVAVALPQLFDYPWVAAFLAARAVPSLERVTPGTYERCIALDGRPIVLRVESVPDSAAGWLRVRPVPRLAADRVRSLVARMFDLDADLAAFMAVADRDPLLRRLVRKRPGIRLPQFLDPFEGVVRAILGQQVSVAAARTLTDRLVQLLGESGAAVEGVSLRAFPRAERLVEAGWPALRTIGLTRAKARAVWCAAQAVAEGRLDLETLRAATGDEAQAALTALPGVGPWTASYVQMRALGDRDAFPAGDLGVLKALSAISWRSRRGPGALAARAERWRPWRAYATLHLWHSLGDQPSRRRRAAGAA